ncbi:hypothetical protein [Janthinobacterium svalbardensis]|jgi:hypothetical protein|nr:hypothetical protein [Janthinobacterium svalbardensis]
MQHVKPQAIVPLGNMTLKQMLHDDTASKRVLAGKNLQKYHLGSST